MVLSDITIADLQHIIQIAMGWSDSHLDRFIMHGEEYGVYHTGGPLFIDDPQQVRLADFGFRLRERFLYEYDVGGRRAVPPEDCVGPWAFMALEQYYSPYFMAQ
jgi:hypothetical protein